MKQIQRSAINSAGAPQPIGTYPQAVRARAGAFLYIAGQVALDASGTLVGAGDVAAQTRQVF
jgi:enamine deaminase RidA (YjgF/YER057c/UK114 family)